MRISGTGLKFSFDRLNLKIKPLRGIFKKKSVISAGIAIDTDFCRVAILGETDRGVEPVVIPFEFDIPEHDDQQIGLILRQEIDRRGLEIRSAGFCVPASMVLYKTVVIPEADEKQLVEAVEWNIQEDIKEMKQNIVYDYSILSKDNKMVSVVVAIVKRSIVDRIIGISESSGIGVDFIDTSGTALLNLALSQKNKVETYKSESNICIVHIDRHDTYILFSNNNIIIQPVDFKITEYENLSADEKEESIVRLINEINYFFLTINEPKIIYTSGYFFKHPEIKAYMQLRFGQRFSLEDLDCIISLDINYSGTFPLQMYDDVVAVAYRGLKG